MNKAKETPELLRRQSKFLPWLVFSFCLLLYANSFNHQYALDDYSIIIEHDHVQAGFDGIGKIMTTNYRNGQSGFNDGLYRPLSLVTFAIEKSLYDNNPNLAHILNALLYAIGMLFLYLSLL